MDDLTLTVSRAEDKRKIAVISTGGHPQRPNSGQCTVVEVEDIDGWGKKKISDWFERMKTERPWETRQ